MLLTFLQQPPGWGGCTPVWRGRRGDACASRSLCPGSQERKRRCFLAFICALIHMAIQIYSGHPRLPPLHPTPLTVLNHEYFAQLAARPLYSRAHRINVKRLEAMLQCRPFKSPAPHACSLGIIIGHKQRRTVQCRGQLCATLVHRLIHYQTACPLRYPLNHATRIASRVGDCFELCALWRKVFSPPHRPHASLPHCKSTEGRAASR